jgi:hypothetical protein
VPVNPSPSAPDLNLAPPPDFDSPRLARLRGKGGSGFARRWVPVIAFVLTGVLTIGTGAYLYRSGYLNALGQAWKPADNTSSTGVYPLPKHNFRFQTSTPGWKEEKDNRTRIDIKAPFALRREEPNSWMAILFQDYQDRTPSAGELIEEGVRRLRDFFKGFEYELKDQNKDLHLAGQHAVHMNFQGELNDTLMAGECWTFSYKGFAYWFVTWASSDNAPKLADEWDELRKGLSLLKEREDWHGPIVKEATLAGDKAPYTLTYIEGLWEKQTPKDYDTKADAALLGHDQTDRKDTARTATALVLLLDKADDLKAAVTDARNHLEKKQKNEYPDTTIEEVQEKNAKAERPQDEIGNLRGRLVRLHVTNGENRERFVYLAVLSQRDQVVVIQCECDWRRRAYWEPNFDPLLRKFHLKTK